MTPDFLDKLEQSPVLVKALMDPAFQQAAAEMASNPQKAIAKYSKERPDLILALKEFAGFLGSHLSDLPASVPIPDDLPAHEKEILQRVLSNPKMQAALKDPQVQMILARAQKDPASLSMWVTAPILYERFVFKTIWTHILEWTKRAFGSAQPELREKLQLLIQCGLLQMH